MLAVFGTTNSNTLLTHNTSFLKKNHNVHLQNVVSGITSGVYVDTQKLLPQKL